MKWSHTNRYISYENRGMSEVKHGQVNQDERINIKAEFLIPFKNGSNSIDLQKMDFFE
jgi:hypothetical protein